MSTAFHAHIQTALSDANLQAALDANAERRITSRLQAMASLPQPLPEMRRRAHALRAEVITHLDVYLAQFTAQAQANGVHVHRAADAAEAIRLTLEVARQNDARLIAKSKTMVSEEIHLNQSLEKAGLRVVETDLGEYIIQLREEPPAHIITPAVHLRRAQVGQTFHEKLGIPLTEDIPTLTQAARRVLRQTFLEADLGISGVNFGVAESGTLCIVTNEGNGRMVTTLPRVHIALMGIERLVPTLEDLALLLYLLPRSATGQKLSVYTSLLHGPRRGDEADGAQQRHLILLDNGRSAMRASPLAEALYCIRCGACLNACPVFRELGGHAYVGIHGENSVYPGPIGSVVAAGLFGQEGFGHLVRASSLCGACKEACPVDIDLPGLLLRVRAGEAPAHAGKAAAPNAPGALTLGLRLFTWAAVSPWRFALAQRAAGLFSRLLAPLEPWLRLPAFTGWGYSKDFPRPAARSFQQRFAERKPAAPLSTEAGAAADEQKPVQPEEPAADQALVERFASELTALGGHFTRCTEEELPGHLLETLRSLEAESLLAWEEESLPPGLLAALRSAGLRVSHQPDANAQAGLSGADAAIAESGSLLLASAAGRPLTASLLPWAHLAILREADILPALPQALAHPALRGSASAALISGPSRTADIEMTLTIGVHGPGYLHVFCLS